MDSVRQEQKVGHDRRVASVAVWDGSPPEAMPIRWSEVAPGVVAKQTLISVELSNGDEVTPGVASLTYYVQPGRAHDTGRFDAALGEWLGTAVLGLPFGSLEDSNPYDPGESPLRAAIELAILDALGRQTMLPAAAFLGGRTRGAIEAYASLPSFAGPDAAVACAADAAAAGFRAVKFHASGVVEADLETIGKARRTLGPGIRLMWDASCGYDLYSAVIVGRALARADFLWFEAPLTDDSTEALRTLSTRVALPLVPDGLVQRSAADWARDAREGIWGALRVDVTRAPGVASALRIVRLAEALGLPCEIQSFGFPSSQYANLQLMLATRSCRFFEAPFPAADFEDGVVDAPRFVDGFVLAPEAYGLGHGIDVDRLAAHCTQLSRVAL